VVDGERALKTQDFLSLEILWLGEGSVDFQALGFSTHKIR
jgi:hypothetical protein